MDTETVYLDTELDLDTLNPDTLDYEDAEWYPEYENDYDYPEPWYTQEESWYESAENWYYYDYEDE